MAIMRWNDAVGYDVFYIERIVDWTWIGFYETYPRGTIPVTMMELGSTRDGRTQLGLCQYTTSLRVPGMMIHARILIDDDLTRHGDLVSVFVHELGHSVGLTHDPNIESIMFPEALSSLKRLMPDDIEYVRSQVTGEYLSRSSVD
jgi:hypothetical protein